MRLTLRTLLAYLDDTLEPAQAKTIGQKVAESDTAQELITRIKQVTRRRRLTTPPDTGPGAKLDPNTIAEYLDNTLDADQLAEVEQTCLASDVHLAEMASCHQILTLVLGEPALVPPTAKQRMYGLVKGREAIAFRKPPPGPRAADAESEEAPVEGKEVDETLRLGVPALRSKDPWANRLILMGGAFGLVACLVVAILMLVIPTSPEDTDIPQQAKGVLKKGNGQKKKADNGKAKAVDAAQKQGKDDKKVVPPEVKDDKSKVGDGKKTPKDKQGSKDGKQAGKVEPPTEPPESLPGPPSKRVVEIGTYEPPMPPATAVLLQYKPGGKSEWERLVKQLKPPRVLTGRPLVSLPAYRSNVKIDKGVRLTLVGTVPEFVLGLPLFESRVVLHQNETLDLDLTLQRGRILLSNLRADRPARVRVRFENTTAPDEFEMWDLTLEEKDTEVLVDRLSFYDGEPFYDNPKHPNRKGPVSNLGLIVLRGSVALRSGNVTHTLQPPPGPALMVWDSRKGPSGPHPLKELPPWTKANPPPPKGMESVRADMERAAVQFGSDLSGWSVELGLEKALKSTDKSLRKLAIRSFGALDMLQELVYALGDVNRPDVRFDAIETLRYWIAASRDNAYTLLAQLKSSDYTPVESEKIVSLLHNYSKDDQGRLETYNTLIDQLVSPKVAIRELSAWHLYRLVPEAQRGIPWGATAPQADLQRIRGQWRELIRQGKVPPPPQKGPMGG